MTTEAIQMSNQAKITKREYDTRMAAALQALEAAKVAPQAYIDNHGDYAWTLEESDICNALWDAVRPAEKALEDLIWEWSTRNWSGQDWNNYALCVANID
jgi:hypothetical protein